MSSEESFAKAERREEAKDKTPLPATSFPVQIVPSSTPSWDHLTDQQKASLESLHQAIPKQQQQQILHDTQSQGPSPQPHSQDAPSPSGRQSSMDNGNKPPVGSDEWHRVRRENHKQVERRRRETINDGINEIARLVPGCEKNKGSILQRAAQYIQQLKEDNSTLTQKWTLDKLLTDQAINELHRKVESLKRELDEARALPDKRQKVESAPAVDHHLRSQHQD